MAKVLDQAQYDMVATYAQSIIDSITGIIPVNSIKFDWSILFDMLMEILLDFLENCGKERINLWNKRIKGDFYQRVAIRQVRRRFKDHPNIERVPEEVQEVVPEMTIQWFEGYMVDDLALI